MGNHDLTPPFGTRLRPGVLEFFKHHFDNIDEADNIDLFAQDFAEDGVWVHAENDIFRGREGVKKMKRTMYPPNAQITNRLRHLYPMTTGSQRTAEHLYFVTGVYELRWVNGESWSKEFICSVLLVDVPGQGMKVKVWNTLGQCEKEDIYVNMCCGLGMFRMVPGVFDQE